MTDKPRLTISELLASSRDRIIRYGPAEAIAAQSAGAVIVDTRSRDVRAATGTIPGSVHIPLSVLYWRLDPTSGSHLPDLADRSRRFILVCADGYSSSIAAATLRDLGFDEAGDLDGGFNGWRAAGFPIQELRADGTAAD